MTMKELAESIQKNPELASQLVKDFKAPNQQVRDFLDSLLGVPVYLAPQLIQVFAQKYRETDPKTLKDLMRSNAFLGALFCDMDGAGYTYLGVSVTGKPLCRLDNCHLVVEMDEDTHIKWIF